MNPIVPLYSGRTRALIQRKNRKAHVASLGAGEQDYLTLCGRWVPVDGTLADLRPSIDTIEAHGSDFCAICGPVFAFVVYEMNRAIESVTRRPNYLRAVR